MTNTINAKQARLIDLERERPAPLRIRMVANTGAAAKSWHWNYDLTTDQASMDGCLFRHRWGSAVRADRSRTVSS
ncbi:MAG: hypothetical protein ACRDNY_02030 [Gaiellaceae bacterium]